MEETPSVEELELPQLEPTPIYRCKEPGCKAWMREEFVPADRACPICKGSLARSIKHLPPVAKAKKRGTAKRKQ